MASSLLMDNIPPGKRRCRRKKRNSKRSSEKENIVKPQTHKSTVIIDNNFNRIFSTKYCSKNVTKQRLTKKYGIFAKGSRSETITRVDLSEEYAARSNADLHKIIDLASGEPKRSFSASHNENIIYTPSINSTPQLMNFSKSHASSIHKESELHKKKLSQKIFEPSAENQTEPNSVSHADIFNRKIRSTIPEECEKYFPESNHLKTVADTKNYLKKKYEDAVKKRNLSKPNIKHNKENASTKQFIIFDPMECLQMINDNPPHQKIIKSKNSDPIECLQMVNDNYLHQKTNEYIIHQKSKKIDSMAYLQTVNDNLLCQERKIIECSPNKYVNHAKYAQLNYNYCTNMHYSKFENMIESSETLSSSTKSNDSEENTFFRNIWATPERKFYPRKINYEL